MRPAWSGPIPIHSVSTGKYAVAVRRPPCSPSELPATCAFQGAGEWDRASRTSARFRGSARNRSAKLWDGPRTFPAREESPRIYGESSWQEVYIYRLKMSSLLFNRRRKRLIHAHNGRCTRLRKPVDPKRPFSNAAITGGAGTSCQKTSDLTTTAGRCFLIKAQVPSCAGDLQAGERIGRLMPGRTKR
jgi:hypothetical protein